MMAKPRWQWVLRIVSARRGTDWWLVRCSQLSPSPFGRPLKPLEETSAGSWHIVVAGGFYRSGQPGTEQSRIRPSTVPTTSRCCSARYAADTGVTG